MSKELGCDWPTKWSFQQAWRQAMESQMLHCEYENQILQVGYKFIML